MENCMNDLKDDAPRDNNDNEWSIGLGGKLPIGFGMELASNAQAMKVFAEMSDDEKQKAVEESRQMHTKNDMISFVTYLGDSDLFR